MRLLQTIQYEFGKCFEPGKFEVKSLFLPTPFLKTVNNFALSKLVRDLGKRHGKKEKKKKKKSKPRIS